MTVFTKPFLAVCMALALVGSSMSLGLAQSDTQASTKKKDEKTATSAAVAKQKKASSVEKFEKAERLESMRYQHLWIAYGAIWLIIFVFVFPCGTLASAAVVVVRTTFTFLLGPL